MFRSFHPYSFPGNKDTHGINTARTVEVSQRKLLKFYIYFIALTAFNSFFCKFLLQFKSSTVKIIFDILIKI